LTREILNREKDRSHNEFFEIPEIVTNSGLLIIFKNNFNLGDQSILQKTTIIKQTILKENSKILK